MRTLLSKVATGLLLAVLLSASAWAQGRIATVDMKALFDGYYKTIEAKAALDGQAADLEKEHTSMVNEWKKLKDEYQDALGSANDQKFSSEERERRKKLAEDKLKLLKRSEDALTEYERSAQTRYADQKQRVHDKVIEEIRAVLEAKAKAAGYSLVLDVAGVSANSLVPIVLYHTAENDITQAILDQLNAAAPAPTVKAPEKQTDKKADKKK